MSVNASTLKEPSVDEAPDGELDPEMIPATGATLRITPYGDMTYRDWLYLFVGEHYTDDIPVSASAVGKDVLFLIDQKQFVPNSDNTVIIRYEVQHYQGAREPSLILELKLKADFQSEARLDLSAENYVACVDKPPRQTPVFARMTREANWGAGPYEYSSSDESIAIVDNASGEVTAVRNGTCSIIATDSQSQTQRYTLTITGIHELHFLTAGANWEGMIVLCMQAKLQSVTLPQIKRLWSLYYPNSGSVADYLGWLNYPVWTGDALGAGTAWSYDLNGTDVNDNASGDDIETFHQVVGIKHG
ncbi:Ig-like domain-containing protein [Pseudomonas sp. MG-9]|uniref:Ig-like domain-containing protein n=1 Tax=Pseudomonas sp. MG-9 TaxID=2839032 RepID=UPI001C000325|nr:Ig-like domain-containing protein [Pseudomonas sp. MG-9]MBT9266334.1 Ig-like domain-containing protein [Pseudomonas sp. MG-9]